MNWYLVLFGFIGIAVVFIHEVYKTGFKNMNWPSVLIRYGVGIVFLFAGVHWHKSKEIQSILTLFAFGALMVFINWGINKVR